MQGSWGTVASTCFGQRSRIEPQVVASSRSTRLIPEISLDSTLSPQEADRTSFLRRCIQPLRLVRWLFRKEIHRTTMGLTVGGMHAERNRNGESHARSMVCTSSKTAV